MADTMRNLFPAEVRFVGGENPSDRKLTNWALMEKDALTLLAQAVGNIWHMDKTLQDRAEDPHPLLFTSLTRAIGNLEMLNPSFLYGYTIDRYAQKLAVGQTEHSLDYWVDLPDNYTAEDLLSVLYSSGFGGEALDDSVILNLDHVKLTPEELNSPGDWTILGRTLYTYSASSGDYLIYKAIWKFHDLAASFSVIPHLSQVMNGSGMEVSKVTGSESTYYILTTPDYLYNYDGGPPHPSFIGKQIPLPKICRYAADQLIPEGLVTLWDLGDPPSYSNAQKIEGALFYGYGDEYHLVVKNVTLEENNGRYVLVCAAEGLAYAVRRLRDQLVSIVESEPVTHDLHSRLRGLRFTGKDTNGNQISGWFPFPRSRVVGHDHTMYLHRMGFDPEDASIWCNAMLGDLMMASTSSTDGWINLESNSCKIRFGSLSGPSIFFNKEANALEVDSILVKPHDHSGGNMGVPLEGRYQVKIDESDTMPNYLGNKLAAGNNITITRINTPIGDKLRISAAAGGELVESSKVKVNTEDPSSGYLAEKILAGSNITLNVEDGTSGKAIRLSSAAITVGDVIGLLCLPDLHYYSNYYVSVKASASAPITVTHCGFPNINSPRQFVAADMTDNQRRVITSDVTIDIRTSNACWGTNRRGWYAVYAIAAGGSTTFTIKAMPIIIVQAHSGINKTISPGYFDWVYLQPIKYGFTVNELVGGRIYVATGASRGEMRNIVANTEDTTSTIITYTGNALNLAARDQIFILPPLTNFRLIGHIFIYFENNSYKIMPFRQHGRVVVAENTGTFPLSFTIPPLTKFYSYISRDQSGESYTFSDYVTYIRTAYGPDTLYVGPTTPIDLRNTWVNTIGYEYLF